MPRYRVVVDYDMNFSRGSETHVFEAKNDKDALKYMKDSDGGMLSMTKRDVRFRTDTLARVVGT